MKISKFKIVKIILVILAIGYLIAINVVPFLIPLRSDFLAWAVFVIYLLNLIFIFSLDKKKDMDIKNKDRSVQLAKEAQETLKSRSRWFF